MTYHANTIYLRAAIKKANISARKAGEIIGRSRNTMLKYMCEQGGRVIPDNLVEALDDALCEGKHLLKLRYLQDEYK